MSELNPEDGTAQGEGITLLGAEMLTWSDADGEVGAFGGLLAPQLLHGFGGSRDRALVAGPTTAAVVLDIAGRFTRTEVLVRSFPDAQHLREALPASIGVFCGPLDRMTGAAYDAVIAVAGTDRLHTAEEDTPAPATVLEGLAALVAEGGELFVAVGNPVGVDRLLSLGSSSSHHDADWPDGLAAHATPALDVEQTITLLAGHGLNRVETWHCHGRRSDPVIAAPTSTFTGRAGDSVLAREVGHAYDVADPAAPAIKDPAATVRGLVRAGLGASTAPLTVLHLRRGGAAADPADALLIQEPVHDGIPPVAYRLVPHGTGWTRELLGEPTTVTAGGLTRQTAALAGPVPSGPTLAEAIEACCAAHDATAAAILVRQYRDWLGEGCEGDEVGADRVAVTPRLLAVDGDGLALLDASWSATAPAPRDVVLTRGLLEVAADLLARGVRHPWSPAASAALITTSLVAAAGIERPDDLLLEAVALDARLRPAGSEGAEPDFDAPGNVGRLSYAELSELAHSAALRAAESDEHVLWLLRRLQGRQRALRATRSRAHGLETSREMWVGRRVFVIGSLIRRFRRRRHLRRNGPAGEWKDPATVTPVVGDDPNAPFTAEEQLLPPGYQPDASKVEVIPNEGD